MPQSPPIRLRRDVGLVDLEIGHAAVMFRWVCDPTISRNIGLTKEPSLEKTRQWIAATREDPRVQPFAIQMADRHVGNVVLDQIEQGLSTARLSIYIGESDVRASGVGTTAVYRVLERAFNTLLLHKVWLTVHPDNFPAINVYSRLGFQLEGIHRDEFLRDGRRVSALYMGLLKPEFHALPVIEDTQS